MKPIQWKSKIDRMKSEIELETISLAIVDGFQSGSLLEEDFDKICDIVRQSPIESTTKIRLLCAIVKRSIDDKAGPYMAINGLAFIVNQIRYMKTEDFQGSLDSILLLAEESMKYGLLFHNARELRNEILRLR